MLTPMGDCLLPVFFGERTEEMQGRNWTQSGEDTKREGQEAAEAWDLSLDSEPVPIIPLCAMYGPSRLGDKAKAKRATRRNLTEHRGGDLFR